MTNSEATLFGPEMLADPYPFYDALRTADPLYWEEQLHGWACTGYKDVVHLLSHPDLSA